MMQGESEFRSNSLGPSGVISPSHALRPDCPRLALGTIPFIATEIVGFSSVWIDVNRRKCSHRAMRTNPTILVVLAGLLTATAATFADNPLMGSWKLNESKSRFAPGATKNTMVTYAPAEGDMVKCTVDGVDKDGKPIRWTWAGRFDGKPYPIQGSPSFDMLTYYPVNDYINNTVATKAGKAVMKGVLAVAKDGKSRVVRLTGTGANGQKFTEMTYYDKQQ
jgi:hypothetical protein